MGRVRVECADGCSCQPVTLDAHTMATISPSNPSAKPDPKPKPNSYLTLALTLTSPRSRRTTCTI